MAGGDDADGRELFCARGVDRRGAEGELAAEWKLTP